MLWVENRPTRGWRSVDLREVSGYYELIWFLALRDIRSHHKQAILGAAWLVVKPVVGTIALVMVFDRFIGTPSDGIPYHLFALGGYAVWTYVSSTTGAVTGSLLGNSSLVTKVYFPRLVIPVAAIIPGLVDLAAGLGVLAILMAIAGHAPPAAVVLTPLVVALAMVIALSLGLWLSTLNVLYRDVGHGLGFLIQLWFFASPVAYPSSAVDDGWRWVYHLNPVAGLIDFAVGGLPRRTAARRRADPLLHGRVRAARRRCLAVPPPRAPICRRDLMTRPDQRSTRP